jgi:uncharacterized membrane protein
MEILFVMYLGAGLLLAGLSIPLILKKIKPNGLYGFRVPQTLDNPKVWYEVNQYSGKWLLVGGIAIVIAAIGLYLLPGISVDGYALAILGVVIGVLGVGLVQSVRYLKRS